MKMVNSSHNGLMLHYTNAPSMVSDEVVTSPPLSRANELTISFEGEVYVFPSVTPEKVPFFLLLLYFQFPIIIIKLSSSC
jgi:hypothetical protein